VGADRRAPGGRPALFARRNFTFGVLALSVAYGLFFGNVVLLPLWLQQWMGYTATWAGMVLAPVGLLAIVLSPLVGKNVGTGSTRASWPPSPSWFALVLWMRSHFTTQDRLRHHLVPTVLQGAAMAFFFIPLTTHHPERPAARASPAPPACPTSCASPPAPWAPRCPPRCGNEPRRPAPRLFAADCGHLVDPSSGQVSGGRGGGWMRVGAH
jgi:hypothetical protein